MERLLECLKALDGSSLPDDKDVRLDSVDHPFVDEISHIATNLLITDKGYPDFDAADRLYKDHGYFIYAGERDQFGWLTACLETKKGFIVFG